MFTNYFLPIPAPLNKKFIIQMKLYNLLEETLKIGQINFGKILKKWVVLYQGQKENVK